MILLYHRKMKSKPPLEKSGGGFLVRRNAYGTRTYLLELSQMRKENRDPGRHGRQDFQMSDMQSILQISFPLG